MVTRHDHVLVSATTVVSDIRQSARYTHFMKAIGWVVENVDGAQAFVKKFPLIGSVIKIQRPDRIPTVVSLKKLRKKYRAFSVTIEPNYIVNNLTIKPFNHSRQSYLPTKTIHVSLKPSETEIFNNFSESTRRAVRKATKNNVVVKNSSNIAAFIALKKKYFFPLGSLFTREIKPLWKIFQPNYAALLLAYKNRQSEASNSSDVALDSSDGGVSETQLLAGIFLLFHQKTCYYWLAASTKEGNKLRAPSLLAAEAMKLAKKKKCTIFDFEGIYDERFPNRNKNWKGFTRFKKGFGGKEVLYQPPLSI